MQYQKVLAVLTVTLLALGSINQADAASAMAASSQTRAVLADADRAVTRGDADQALNILSRHQTLLTRSGAAGEQASIACQAYFLKAEFDAAIAQCTVAIESRSAHWSDFNNRGAARSRAGDLAGAIADFETARQLSPASRDVRKNMTRTRQLLRASR